MLVQCIHAVAMKSQANNYQKSKYRHEHLGVVCIGFAQFRLCAVHLVHVFVYVRVTACPSACVPWCGMVCVSS